MQNLYKSRYVFLITLIFLYLVPIMLLSSYGRLYMPAQQGWNLLVFGLCCSFLGTLGLFLILCRMGRKVEIHEEEEAEEVQDVSLQGMKLVVQSPEIDAAQSKALEELQEHYASNQEKLKHVQEELEAKNEELRRLQHEYQILQHQLDSLQAAHEEYKQSVQDELEQQRKLVADSQKTISDQREGIDKKLQQISQLESKVSDLTYEIKTLIQLAEIENQSMPIYPSFPTVENPPTPIIEAADDEIPHLPEKQVRNETEAGIQLKRCIDIAQKITGASHYNSSNSRFKDLAIDNYTLDLRRLFDSLRMENASAIVFYSQKENKVLFVNNQTRNLLGWSPDKFVLSFNDIVEPSKDAWRQGIASLAIKNAAHISLKMKSKSGSPMEVQALLGIIPTGLFRHHVLGVLYQK